jgi:hypothetical protein
LAATRRFGWWLSRLWWREWWSVAVAVDGRRKVAKERGSAVRSLYEVVWRLIVMEMEVFKPVVTMLVVEHRGGEREREREIERERESLLAAETRLGRLVFWLYLDPNLSTFGA